MIKSRNAVAFAFPGLERRLWFSRNKRLHAKFIPSTIVSPLLHAVPYLHVSLPGGRRFGEKE